MITEDRSEALAILVSMVEPYSEPPLGTQGSYQSVVGQVKGVITLSGNLSIQITANGMANSPKTVSIAVLLNDSAYDVTTKIRTGLSSNSDVSGFFSVSGSGVNVILTSKSYAANDSTMNLSIDNGTATGLTNAHSSTILSQGSVPDLTELEAILDDNLLATTWKANTDYVLGQYIYPSVRNGHKYIVSIGGNSGATEPTWTTGKETKTISSAVTFLEDGAEFDVGYDIDHAAWDAWNKKAAKASEFTSTPGIDMSKIFDRCEKMRDSFQSAMVA